VDDEVPSRVVDQVVHKVHEHGEDLCAVLVELNLRVAVDANEAEERFREVYRRALGKAARDRPAPYRVSAPAGFGCSAGHSFGHSTDHNRTEAGRTHQNPRPT
jgi:hypothetical protein